MTTIITGTNRVDSNTLAVSTCLEGLYQRYALPHQVFGMDAFAAHYHDTGTYGTYDAWTTGVAKRYIREASRILFVVPEYNGSMPGILKLYIDYLPPDVWKGKRTALVGVATGRSGNVRGLEHLTSVLHYLGAEVYHGKLPLSNIHLHLAQNKLSEESEYYAALQALVQGFEQF